MLQIIVTIVLMVVVLGGLLAISLSRGEGKELKKSCGCAIPDAKGEPGSCVSNCES